MVLNLYTIMSNQNAKMNNIISNSEFKIPTRYPDRGTNFFLIQFIYHSKTLLIKLNIMLELRLTTVI